jgi:hypothetical protein
MLSWYLVKVMFADKNLAQESPRNDEIGWRGEAGRSWSVGDKVDWEQQDGQAGRTWQGGRAHHPACVFMAQWGRVVGTGTADG